MIRTHYASLLILLCVAAHAQDSLRHISDTGHFAIVTAHNSLNQPPIVNAGSDTAINLGNPFRFSGSVTDGGVATELRTEWTVISGPPDGAIINAPWALRSSATITATGTYLFELVADDGTFTVKDTMQLTVYEAVPFMLHGPLQGERIELGSVYTLSWQIDIKEAVAIMLSADGGDTYNYLVSQSFYDTVWVWNVSTSLELSDQCIIKVVNYHDRGIYALSEQFSLVCSSNAGNRTLSPYFPHWAATTEYFTIDGRRYSPFAFSSHSPQPVLSKTAVFIRRRDYYDQRPATLIISTSRRADAVAR